jgi:hypothetical protein
MHLDLPTSAPADVDLVAACAAVIDMPKAAPPDSFVLHAPLELLARALLLERLPEDGRDRARQRLQWLADKYAGAGPSAEAAVLAALDPDLDLDQLVPSLAAAGHGPILLSLRPRVTGIDPAFGARGVAAELARYPDWALSWQAGRSRDGAPAGDLVAALLGPRSPGDPGSDFIYPTMHLTETSGLAAEVLDGPLRGLDVASARAQLLRVAAHSMLQDDPDRGPYGWSHCLTMPQAVLDVADQCIDPGAAIAVAATYVLGFRSTLGTVTLDPAWAPTRPAATTEPARALAGTPNDAAAAVWWAVDADLAEIEAELVAYAALHPDAHLAKYTLACLDAAALDPDASRLFLAAAAHLGAWWRAIPFPDDPIIGTPDPA